MIFNKEADFEQALIDLLKTKGWEDKVIYSRQKAGKTRFLRTTRKLNCSATGQRYSSRIIEESTD